MELMKAVAVLCTNALDEVTGGLIITISTDHAATPRIN